MNRRKTTLGAITAALTLTLVTACGSGSNQDDAATTKAVADAATYSGADRQQVLTTKAAKESQLSIYTSMGLDDFNVFIEGFAELYPDIKVDVYSATGEKVVQRALTEYQAKRYDADVVLAPLTDVSHLLTAGDLQQYTSPEVPKGVDMSTMGGAPVYLNRFVMAWNTDQVSAADVPTSYQDLLDPKWQGKIGIEAGDVPWMATLFQAWGDEAATSYFEKLAAQKPFVQDSHTTLAELVGSGEVPLSPNVYDYDAEALKQSGAPIDWAPLDPLVVYPYVVGLPTHSAHPNASMLFIDYLLSKKGQEGIAALGRTPADPNTPPQEPGLQDIQALPTTSLDPATWSKNLDKYNQIWQSLIRN
ncbi:MAG: fbpA 1 [Nocardioides sp.]|nr:fbpA 1 [Nocardioides sp.]